MPSENGGNVDGVDVYSSSVFNLFSAEHLLDMLAAILVCCLQIQQALAQLVHITLQILRLPIELLSK